MELRRSRSLLVVGLVYLPVAVWILLILPTEPVGWIRWGLFGLVGALMSITFIVTSLQPFRFHIGPDGLDIRHGQLRRSLRWHEIDSIVLADKVPIIGSSSGVGLRLLLVPALGTDLGVPLDMPSPVDRPAATVLDLAEVRQKPDEVAEALTRFAGSRYRDGRGRTRANRPEFVVVLRGYARPEVDKLIDQALRALDGGSANARRLARLRLDGTTLTVDVRGYDRPQVDEYLTKLKSTLATWPGETSTTDPD
jgi:hypothetical protein